MEEIWKDIPEWEGLYQASTHGRIRSLDRLVKCRGGKHRMVKGRVYTQVVDSNGYQSLSLCVNNTLKRYTVHKLIAITFLNHKPNGYKEVIDHIDRNKLNNNVENLRLVTARENSANRVDGASKYTGVSWNTLANKWKATIMVNGKNKHLGYHDCELRAHLAYQTELDKLINLNIK